MLTANWITSCCEGKVYSGLQYLGHGNKTYHFVKKIKDIWNYHGGSQNSRHTVSEKDILLYNCSPLETLSCPNEIVATKITPIISVFSPQLFTLRHWILHFLLHKYQMLLQARYLYHVLIISLCLFFVIHTNQNESRYAFTETYGTEIKVCSWALVTIHTKTILSTWIRERSNEKSPKLIQSFGILSPLNSITPLFIIELNPLKTSVP